MKKYEDYTKEELLSVIKYKNDTISRLNGSVYYYKRLKNHYIKMRERYYSKLKTLGEFV